VDEDTEEIAVYVPLSTEDTCHLSPEPLIGLLYVTAVPESAQKAVPPELPFVGVVVFAASN